MYNQIKAERYKLFTDGLLYILLLVVLTQIVVYNIPAFKGLRIMVTDETIGLYQKVYENENNIIFLEILRTSFSLTPWVSLVLFLFSLIKTSLEYTLGTNRNFIERGINKIHLFFAKTIVIIITCVLIYMLLTLSVFISTLIMTGVMPTGEQILFFITILLLNALILIATILFTNTIYFILKSSLIAGLGVTILNVFTLSSYPLNFRNIEDVSFLKMFIYKVSGGYYWSNLCAGRLNIEILASLLINCSIVITLSVIISIIVIKKREVWR